MAHFLNKRGGGGGYFGGGSSRRGKGREWPEDQIVDAGNFLERRDEEKRKKKRGRRSPGRTGICGGAPARVAPFGSYVAQSCPAGRG
jgi:hypothetical protein